MIGASLYGAYPPSRPWHEREGGVGLPEIVEQAYVLHPFPISLGGLGPDSERPTGQMAMTPPLLDYRNTEKRAPTRVRTLCG
jgi:hypothetical protein